MTEENTNTPTPASSPREAEKAEAERENDLIRRLLRKRLLAMLQDEERVLRGSTLSQIVGYLKDLEKLEKKPTPEEQAAEAAEAMRLKTITTPLPFPPQDDDEPPVRVYHGGRFGGDEF